MESLLRRWALVLAIVAAALLASGCEPAETPAVSAPLDLSGRAAPAGTLPLDAHQRGVWSPVMPWPLIPIHVVLLPDGRVMSFGTQSRDVNPGTPASGRFSYDLWSPSLGFDLAQAHRLLPNGPGTDLFCASQILLPGTGGVLVSGGSITVNNNKIDLGNNHSNRFDFVNDALTRGPDMNRGRWYASATTLLNGEVYVQGGTQGEDHPEVRQLDGRFRLLDNIDTGTLRYYYPRNYVVLDGRIFGYTTDGNMYYVDPAGNGVMDRGPPEAPYNFAGDFPGDDSSSAMFRPGRILQFGGNYPTARVIDVTAGGRPVISSTQSPSTQRRLVTATLLANGDVLATGGSERYNELIGVNNSAEMWSPERGIWTRGASGTLARLYHSSALLLPDGSVLVGGGGQGGPLNNVNVEIYYPPYLFAPGGNLALRPRIVDAPATLVVGRSFDLRFSDVPAVARVVLVKNGAQTHGYNQDQRFVELPFTASGTQLSVKMPSRPSDTPPGHYMLVVLDASGVPSIAHMTWINSAAAPDPATAPTLTNPGDRASAAGTALTFDLAASDPNGEPLTFSAAGLPPGLAIDAATGRIGGTPITPGTYHVVVAVDDGAAQRAATATATATATFTWLIEGDAPLVLQPAEPAAPVIAGTAANFSADASGSNARYSWNFGDGTAASAPSASGDITHGFARPGVYFVTVTVTDDRGAERRNSFMQTVHLPLSAGTPGASSNILFQTVGAQTVGAGSRLWVVNQDQDSVSLFDAASLTRLAEVPVGRSPRSLAVSGVGQVWVTNQRSASISVIDPVTRRVVRSVALPRASQPYGIVMSPDGELAYVVLAGSGRVLRYRTRSYALSGAVDVGPDPRQVSVSADGLTLLVSRFITPPQPGESTAAVGSAVDGVATGGEVIRVNAINMTVSGISVLGHSVRSDAENQGRGVPNYLGAATISPDGSQAWVPSKQDNLRRGMLRDGLDLNFQNTVRAISSRLDLGTFRETAASRIDHDNASVASAAAYDRLGVFLFVALETSREVAILNAHDGSQLLRIDVGLAPQGLALSGDGNTLFVHNFMDRSVSVFDLRPLTLRGELRAPQIASLPTVADERLGAQVLRGKQLFYDARDPRLSLDRYMSCAACHNDGGHDGRTWDFTGLGEGLRNTPALRGRAGAANFLHWSGNFDEVQDFEAQIRGLSGGGGLLDDVDLAVGDRAVPLGQAKAAVSADLDALAAYLTSLDSFDPSPLRGADGALSAAALAGRRVFEQRDCASCHGGEGFTLSAAGNLIDVGTLRAASGRRSGATLSGIDVPTLRDVWATAPYLHDGSAMTLDDAVRAHAGSRIGDDDLSNLVVYLRSIDGDEPAPGTAVTGDGDGATGGESEFRNASGGSFGAASALLLLLLSLLRPHVRRLA